MPKLFIYPKKGDSFLYSLKPERISIGRSEDNELPLPDPFSSGHHALIYSSDGAFVLRDNGSKNGTFLNGKKVQGEVELKRGDEILIGSTRLIFDKELSSNVEMTEVVSPARNINTILPLREILTKQDIETTLQGITSPSDLMKIKSDYKSLAVLNEVSKALVLHQPLNELLERVMELISEYMPMDRGILMIQEGNPSQLIPKVIRINNKSLAQKKIQVSQSIVSLVLDKHSSVLTTDALADPRFMMKDSVIKSRIHSAMCVPLWNNKEIIGVIYSDRISLVDQFTEDDLRLLTLLSNLAAVKIENARLIEKAIEQEKMEKELALAARIQKDFLPKENPAREKFDIAGTNIPCYQVGGDYYDFITIDPGRLGVIVADVSGKGISASLLMASLRAALYSEVHPKFQLAEMAAKLNDFVHRSSAVNMFITFFFCELDMNTGRFRYINAGHNPPLLIKKSGKVERLGSCGFCLGMFPSVAYEVKEASFNMGDSAVFYTDGITESRNKDDQEYGEERLVNFLKKNVKLPASMIVEKIYQELTAFSTGVPPLDDMTCIVVKRVA
jgi:serine phosphatase RsbU (regulator of sigma subunit)